MNNKNIDILFKICELIYEKGSFLLIFKKKSYCVHNHIFSLYIFTLNYIPFEKQWIALIQNLININLFKKNCLHSSVFILIF